MVVVRKKVKLLGFQDDEAEVVMKNWKKSTIETYETGWKLWLNFCSRSNYAEVEKPEVIQFCYIINNLI